MYCSPWGPKELDMTEQLNNSHKRNWNTPTLLVDTQNGAAAVENCLATPQKVKHGVTIGPSTPPLGVYLKD